MANADRTRQTELGNVPSLDELATEMLPFERRWKDRQLFLASHGYMLRRRYQPDWVPSWRASARTMPFHHEDAWSLLVGISA